MAQNREYRIVNGLNRLWVTKNVKDTENEKEYEELIELRNLVNVSYSPEGEATPVHGSNRVIAMLQSKQGGGISIEMNDLQKDLEIMISGAEVGENGTVMYSEDDISPYVGVIAEFTNHDGTYNYHGFPKVIFNPTSTEASTKTDSNEAQSVTIEGTILQNEYDGKNKFEARSYDDGFDLELFFTDVLGDLGNQ